MKIPFQKLVRWAFLSLRQHNRFILHFLSKSIDASIIPTDEIRLYLFFVMMDPALTLLLFTFVLQWFLLLFSMGVGIEHFYFIIDRML